MPWVPCKLRDAEVWARADERGELVTDASGRVEVVYKAQPGAKVYRAGARNLLRQSGAAVDFEAGEPAPERPAKPARGGAASASAGAGAIPEGAIAVWTDGACTGNPGPCGIGVVVVEDGERREASEYLGEGTNNIAELVAIERGLELVRDRQRCVLVHSDSSYALGLLGKNWKAKANAELVARLRKLAGEFADVRWIKVKGHAGVPENERCDQLARDAITNRGRR